MSVQTGSMSPPGPASARFVDRARFRFRLWESQPNPLWIRELRQSARLGRTPVILTVVTVLMVLLIATLGGIVSTEASPATTGVVVFQVFFSVAYFVVTLVGPAVAANSIASEREGRTWEAHRPAPHHHRRRQVPRGVHRHRDVRRHAGAGGRAALPLRGRHRIEVVVAFAGLVLVALLSVPSAWPSAPRWRASAPPSWSPCCSPSPEHRRLPHLRGRAQRRRPPAWPGVADGPPIWLPPPTSARPSTGATWSSWCSCRCSRWCCRPGSSTR